MGVKVDGTEDFLPLAFENTHRCHDKLLTGKVGQIIGADGSSRDITERNRQQNALAKSRQHDKILAELTGRLLECEDIKAVLQDIGCAVMRHLDLDIYMSFLADSPANQLSLYAFSGLTEAEAERTNCVMYGQGITGTAALEKRRVVRGDLGRKSSRHPDMRVPEGVLSYVCYPLLSKGTVMGTLGFGSKRRDFFTEDELIFLNVITNNIAIAMSRIVAGKALAESEERSLMLVDKLKAADKSKSEFLNSLSHELRNPLATIAAGLSLLEVSDKARSAEVIAALKSQLGQLCRLVDDLLDLTRITYNKIMLKPERVDLRALLQSTVNDHRALFDEKGVVLEADLGTQPLYVEGDAARLMQIIGNLLQNAHKYTEGGGRVTVRALSDTGKALISVEDTGIGITPELLPNVFEPFMQGDLALDGLNSGLGLGLTIVKSIAELHGGSVSADSAGPGKGAVFTISLPVTDASNGH